MTRGIDSDARIEKIRLQEQASDPSTPPSGYGYLYPKTDGKLYFINDDGTVRDLTPGVAFIQEITPTGATGTFSSIPQTYSKIFIEYVARSAQAATVSSMSLWANQDYTATNYQSARGFNYAAGTFGAAGAADSIIDDVIGNTGLANAATYGTLQVGFYKATTFFKQFRMDSSHHRDAATVFEIRFYNAVSWKNTAAINRLDFTIGGNNFMSGTTFRLYGIT